MKTFRSLAIVIFLVISTAVIAQEEEINTVGFRFLDYQGNRLPEDMLSTKTVVFVSVPTVSENSSERGDWKKLAREAHPTFREAGVDPVKYYYMDDVLASDDVSKAIAAEMSKREIANIIVLSHVLLEIKNKDTERYVIVATPFNNKPTFMDNGQIAWKAQSKDLDKTLKSFSKDASKLGAVENLLISESPEFFETIDIFERRRYEDFNQDLRIDKLAVPKYTEIEIPQNLPGGAINNNIKKEVEEYNQSVPKLNQRLEQIFSQYPYEYKLVDPDMDDKALRAQGFDFILRRLNTSGFSIKQLLGYETNDMTEDYVTVKKTADGKSIFRSIPKHAPVYKYYIEHIYSGDIYLGNRWDADESWYEALENHLKNLLEAIEKE